MSKDSSAKYYFRDDKERLQEKTRKTHQILSKEEKKK